MQPKAEAAVPTTAMSTRAAAALSFLCPLSRANTGVPAAAGVPSVKSRKLEIEVDKQRSKEKGLLFTSKLNWTALFLETAKSSAP